MSTMCILVERNQGNYKLKKQSEDNVNINAANPFKLKKQKWNN